MAEGFPPFERLALIGIGLIGSSIAHATRRGGLARHIAVHAKSAASRETALRLGLADSVHATAADAVQGADLIVIGSHRPAMSTYLLGSNAKTIVRHAKCSVLVLRD